MSQDIHAPYHFVPHAKQVLMPDWAHLVSHDVPFGNGLSGVLSVTLKNETPLCVGGGKNKKDGEPAQVLWAKDPLGNAIIPGSSLKGMIRNVMEIATLGKLNAVDDQQFSFRDISSSNGNYLGNVIKSKKVQSGWLKYNSTQQRWEFTQCHNVKVKHEDINKVFGSKISNADEKQRAEHRYEQLPLTTQAFANISEKRGKQDNRWADDLAKTGKGEFNSKQQGHFVFTNKRIEGKGDSSYYEFSYFFYGENDQPSFTEISNQVDALFSNHNENHVKHLQKEQGDLGIPVFALIEKNKGALHSLGLAKMPRVSYKNTVHDLIGNNSKTHLADSIFDFSELIFGTLRESALSLKSRVVFSDAIAHANNPALQSSNSLILNSPKPTFFPAYLEQPIQGSYSDYDGKSQLAGFKRYISKAPEQLELTNSNVAPDKHKVASRLQLAPKDSTFTSRIVFHNLLPVELGALLWCLSLGGDDKHFHQLGHGKPYGAGAVQLAVDLDRIQENNPKDKAHTVESLTQDFSDYMNSAYNEDKPDAWINSPQIQNLLALSDLKANEDVDTSYMSIDDKEFQQAKTAHERLEPFNNLNRSDSDIQTSLAFGKGRLSNLTKDLDWEKKSIKKRKAKEVRIAQVLEDNFKENKARVEKEKIQKYIDSLSPGMAIIERLKIDIKEQSKPDITVKIKKACEEFTNRKFSINEAEELNKIMRKEKYNKGNDNNKKAYKTFTEKYEIQN